MGEIVFFDQKVLIIFNEPFIFLSIFQIYAKKLLSKVERNHIFSSVYSDFHRMFRIKTRLSGWWWTAKRRDKTKIIPKSLYSSHSTSNTINARSHTIQPTQLPEYCYWHLLLKLLRGWNENEEIFPRRIETEGQIKRERERKRNNKRLNLIKIKMLWSFSVDCSIISKGVCVLRVCVFKL